MIQKIIQVGAGGNGSWLVPHICRIMNHRSSGIRVYRIYDGDTVEEKNLLRQNFSQKDLGRNKAEALAVRYSSIYGKSLDFTPHYINDETLEGYYNHVILIGCVDNNKTRLMMQNAYKRFHDSIYIDIGNEEYWGQIFISSNAGERYLFDNVKYSNDKHPDELSCAERLESGAQSPIINSYMAVLVANLLYSLIVLKKTIDYYKIIANTNNIITRYLVKDYKKLPVAKKAVKKK